MKKMSPKPVLFMMIITLLFTGVLATINEVTAERISLNEEAAEQRSFLYVVDVPSDDFTAEEVNQRFNEIFEEREISGNRVYEATIDGDLIGYVYPMVDSALWGELRGIIGIDVNFERILGVDFLSHNETPGLGGRIDEDEFKEQFRDLDITEIENGNYVDYSRDDIDAISGATGTSDAVSRIINNHIEEFLTEVRGEL